jgi:hypothetical protein
LLIILKLDCIIIRIYKLSENFVDKIPTKAKSVVN